MAELKFVLFVAGISAIFFLPNGRPTLTCLGLSLAVSCVVVRRGGLASVRKQIYKILRFLPFVGFVMLCNGLFASWTEAAWVGAKLMTVCILTVAYGSVTTASETARALARILRPLRRFGLD